MELIVLLLVLGLRRMEIDWPAALVTPDRHQRWLTRVAGRFESSSLGWILGVLLPVLLLGLVMFWPVIFLPLWMLLLGPLLLLWLLGGQSEFRLVEELLVRGRLQDSKGFEQHADSMGVAGKLKEPTYGARLVQTILGREVQLFAVIFWFILGGFPVALLYVLNSAWLSRASSSNPLLDVAQIIHQFLVWLPSRLLVLCMALVGNFSAVMTRMSGEWLRVSPSIAVMQEAASAALSRPADVQEKGLEAITDELEELQGLLLRCLAVWLILAAMWVMIS